MNNQDDSQDPNNRKADMSQVAGKKESSTTSRTQAANPVATHRLLPVHQFDGAFLRFFANLLGFDIGQ